MATGRKPGGPGNADIPDLDVVPRAPAAPRVPGASAGHPSGTPAPRISGAEGPLSGAPRAGGTAGLAAGKADASSPQDYFGSGTFDADHFGEGGVSLSLDTGDAAAPAGTFGGGQPFMGSTVSLGGDADPGDDLDLFQGSLQNAQAVATRPPDPRQSMKWPRGVTPEAAALSIDRVEVDVLAGHGPPPGSPLLAPLYAARVLSRRRDLRAAVQQLAARFTAAEAERDRLLTALSLEVRGKLALTPEGEALLQPVEDVEKLAMERRDHLSGASAEYGRFAAEVKAQTAMLDAEQAAADSRIAELEAALQAAQVAFQRADARKKRLYIEVRGLVEAAEKSGGNTPQQAARLAELERLIAEQRPEHEAANAALEGARAALAQASGGRDQVVRRRREVERQARAQHGTLQKQLGTRTAGVNEAENDRARALADVGRAVLAARGRLVDVPAVTLAAIEKGDEMVVARAMELEKHVRALDAHDAGVMKTGIAISVGAAALLLVVVLFFALGSDGGP